MVVFKRHLIKSVMVLATIAVLCGGWIPGALAGGDGKTLADYGFAGLDETFSVDLRSIDLVEAFKFLGGKGKLNIVTSKEVGGNVSLLFENVTVGDALETLLSSNRLAYVVKGGIIQVMTENEYRALNGVSFSDKRQLKAVEIKNGSAKAIAQMLENVKSDQGTIYFDENTSTLLLTDIPSKLVEMEKVINLVDKKGAETETRTFVLQNSKLEDVMPEVAKVITKETGSYQADKRTKTLIVTDTVKKLAEIESIVAAFDKPIKSVQIEARVVSVRLKDQFRFGIDWDSLKKWTLPVEIVSEGVMLQDIMQKTLANGTLENGIITDNVMRQDLTLDILDTFGDTEIISDPRISVQSGKEATLKVVQKEAYESGTSEVDGGGVTTSYRNFDFVEVGVLLSVLPEVNDDGFISMRIKPEVSEVIGWYGGGEREAGAVPIVRSSTAETTVSVKDGVTVMIAGLIKESEAGTTSKVPFLGSIPGLGKVFTHEDTANEREEVIIFLTPRIVDGTQSVDGGGYSTPRFPEVLDGRELKGLRD
ncbi:MAG: secretin N-terminal domain-containing protein [Lentisphaeria bacterium]|nr:secretin N-terminal domain-containing protein [Lentisphaeria bacterium]